MEIVNVEFRYCIKHAREVILEDGRDEDGKEFHLETLDKVVCHGPFVFTPPPSHLKEPLQEWEWELIFEMEGEIYGTESIF